MATLTQVFPQQGTLSAMRSPDFRLYFAGQLVSISGTWMQNVAQGYLVFSITRSELWLGIIACAAGLPLVLLSPAAGVIVERVPRRQIMLITQTIQMLLAFILAALTFTNTVHVWHIVILAALLGTTNAVDAPARQTIVMEMVGRKDLPSGIALNSILNSASRVLGPTAAGLALVQLGPAWCFLINGASFLAVLISLNFLHVPYEVRGAKDIAPLQQLREGLRFARQHEIIAPLLLLAATVGLFVVPIIQILPAFADLILHSPKEGYAAISAGQGIGSVVGGLLVGWLSTRLGRGRLIGVMVGCSTTAIFLLALQVSITPAAIMSGLSGLCLILQMVTLNTLLQTVVPDVFRGRVLSLYTLTLLGLAPFGSLLLGAAASQIGTSPALMLYAVISAILGITVLMRWPTVIRQA